MKKGMATALAGLAAVLVLLGACQKKDDAGGAAEGPSKLVVWSFTDELGIMVNDYFKPSHPDIEVEYTLTPWAELPSKLDPVLASGQGAPDLFALEDGFVRKYVESGLLLDITGIYEANKSKLIDYQVQVGSYNGKVYGLSWQATPGAVYYRRSFAKKYLGTDDPEEVQTYFADFDKMLAAAALLKERSNGTCYLTLMDYLAEPYRQSRAKPWVVDGKLYIDPKLEEYMDMAKTLQDKGYSPRGVRTSTEGEYAFMRDELKDDQGRTMEEFCVFLPTWGLHYVLKNNAPNTAGDWGLIQGPMYYRSGGTWVGAYKGTKNAAAVKEFIRYVATDDAFLEAYAKATGDLISNWDVINRIKDSYSEPFLAGQNHYAFFAEAAKGVNGALAQSTDGVMRESFQEAVVSYINGEKTKQQALDDFKSQINSTLGL